MLLNVWGTWCVECRAEHPVLLDIQREGKVAVVGLNYKDDDDAARQWLAELGNPYTRRGGGPRRPRRHRLRRVRRAGIVPRRIRRA